MREHHNQKKGEEMKSLKLVVALVATVAVFVFEPKAIALPQGQGAFPDPVVTFYSFTGPEMGVSSYSHSFFLNAINGMKNDLLSVGGNNPAGWKLLLDNQITPGQATITDFAPSWNGVFAPSGPFRMQYGNTVYPAGFKIQSDTPISLADIIVGFRTPFHEFESSLYDANILYENDQVEAWTYGLDGIFDTADDKKLKRGEEALFANYFIGLGPEFSFRTSAENQPELNQFIKSWENNQFDYDAFIRVGGIETPHTLHIVPEPGTISIIALFLGGAALYSRRKR